MIKICWQLTNVEPCFLRVALCQFMWEVESPGVGTETLYISKLPQMTLVSSQIRETLASLLSSASQTLMYIQDFAILTSSQEVLLLWSEDLTEI